jgi:Trk K+ transport system NAD-binding subunit
VTFLTRDDVLSAYHRRPVRRRLWAMLRDTWVLIREFRDGVLLFAGFTLLGAILFRLLWNYAHASAPPMRYIEAVFHVLSMTFLQPALDFPPEWYLDLFYFVMPLLGIVALAHGLADFGTLMFNRKSRLGQWEEAVASTMSDHIIVAGLGHLGIRVVRELVVLDEDIVIIEAKTDTPRVDEVRTYGIPVITGDARSPDILRRAGVDQAGALIICTNDDLSNLQIASRVRELNKDIRLVMRMFDDAFARSMADRFDVAAVMSASMMAAPAFAGAATGTEIIQTFRVADKVLAMGRLEVQPGSRLEGADVHAVERELDLSVVLHQSGDTVDVRPEHAIVLKAKDMIAVVAELPRIKELAHRWNRPNRK